MSTHENIRLSSVRLANVLTFCSVVGALFVATSWGQAAAFQVPVDNPNLTIRFDNTIRYTLGMRVEERDEAIANTPTSDDSEFLYDKWDLTTSRIDILTELDAVYQPSYKNSVGFRVSVQSWWDPVFPDESETNPDLANSTSYIDHEFSTYTNRFYQGPSAELMDALVSWNTFIAGKPVSITAGRHVIYWGEALLLTAAIHGISYSQMPLDLQRGFALPGVEAQELFRPLTNVSAKIQLSPRFTLEGQYFLEWEPYRYPEGGTFLGLLDPLFRGPDGFSIAGLGFVRNGDPVEPDNVGEWGIALRWRPQWVLGSTAGFYYRNFADKLPQILLAPGQGKYFLVYPKDIDLYGISFAAPFAGISWGFEFSYRHNMPLKSQAFGVVNQTPEVNGDLTPRGDTYALIINALGLSSRLELFGIALYDTATWIVEVVGSHWDDISQGESLFYAEGFAPCENKDKWDGCVTDYFASVAVKFTPKWLSVFPSVDLSMPISYSRGIYGSGAVRFGGVPQTGSYSIGLAADVYKKYSLALQYIDYYGKLDKEGGRVVSQTSALARLQDRGRLVFTFGTTF